MGERKATAASLATGSEHLETPEWQRGPSRRVKGRHCTAPGPDPRRLVSFSRNLHTTGKAQKNASRPPGRLFYISCFQSPYFFSGSGFGLNGNVLNIFFAWFCICSCICTNIFFDCSM